MDPEPSPLRLFCHGCGADADAADAVFVLGSLALVVEADLPLVATQCKSCETATDVVLWPSEPGLVARVLAAGRDPERGEAALLGRYSALVDGYERQVRAQHAAWTETDDLGPFVTTLDLDGVDLQRLLAPPLDRPLAVPAAALAAVRGARRAVEAAAEPSLHARVRIGHLTVVLSLDPGDILHLSVSSVAGTAPAPVEQHLALALGFEPSERLRLSARPGEVVPVVHFYVSRGPLD
jgi:hypothetical protein